MILNGSAHVFLNFKKQSLKNDPGTQQKLGMLNVIKQLLHLNFINMRFYGAEYNNKY